MHQNDVNDMKVTCVILMEGLVAFSHQNDIKIKELLAFEHQDDTYWPYIRMTWNHLVYEAYIKFTSKWYPNTIRKTSYHIDVFLM